MTHLLLLGLLAPSAHADDVQAPPIDAAEAAALLASLPGLWEGVAFDQEVTFEIQGDQMMETVGSGQIGPDTIEVVTPCSLMRNGANGGSTMVPFVVHEGRVWLHYGAYAVKRGDDVWACKANQVVQLAADGTCTQWDWYLGMANGKMAPNWAPKPAECRMDGSTFVLGDVRFEDRGGFWSVEDPARKLAPAADPAPAGGEEGKKKKKKG